MLGGVKSACKDPSFAQSLVIFANQTWQLPEWPFQTLTYMFYKLPLQIQTIEGTLQYKIAPLTPPTSGIPEAEIFGQKRRFSAFGLQFRLPNLRVNMAESQISEVFLNVDETKLNTAWLFVQKFWCIAYGQMFFWPDIWFRPKVKNILSVIHCPLPYILNKFENLQAYVYAVSSIGCVRIL